MIKPEDIFRRCPLEKIRERTKTREGNHRLYLLCEPPMVFSFHGNNDKGLDTRETGRRVASPGERDTVKNDVAR